MADAMNDASNDFLDSQISCRHLIEISPDAILIHHQDRIVLVNEECLRLFGVSKHNDLLGLSPLDLAPLETRPVHDERFRTVVAEHKQAPLFETTVLRRDGAAVFVETLAIPMPRHDGTTAVLVAFRDISERQRAIEARLRSEKQVRTILDTAMDGIISMNENQNIVLFNAAAETIFGWRADQVLGRSIDLLIPQRFADHHRTYVEQFGRGIAQNRRMSVQRTVMALRSSGEEFPIEASISKSTIDGERVYTVILRDVTEAVRYRQQIEQQSQMLDQVSDSVSVVDASWRITFWNQGAQRLFGWSADDAIGKDALEFLFRADEAVLAPLIRAANEQRSWSGELTTTTRSGKAVTLDHRQTILHDAKGDVKGYLCIDIDITNRKRQDRLSLRSQRLESIGTLAGGIAHDLNNVLTPILMGAKLLSSNRPPSDRQGLLDTMVASAQRGAGLIQQLLSFAGGIQGERHPVQIRQLIDETRGLLEHTLSKSIQIKASVAPDCPFVLGDTTELSQILMNLCINARDAMPDGGTLSIEAESALLNGTSDRLHPDAKPGRYVVLKVSDTGFGMSSEIMDRIFDPFFTTKEIGKGTGLGLATVQGIVKSHGGFVLVYSEPGRGSKFSVFLPAAQKTDSASDTAVDVPVEAGEGRLLLLVDDEDMILQMAAAALESADYRVLTANNGEAAIATFKAHSQDIEVVLLDMMMPGMDGMQVLDQLLRINPEVKVIACSGLRTTQRETDIVEHGAKAFIPKPYSSDQLLHTLSQVLATEVK
jgi:PAS domain S-box-containing protein